jgi:uncharacterized protein YndB with AHSA1/START domain
VPLRPAGRRRGSRLRAEATQGGVTPASPLAGQPASGTRPCRPARRVVLTRSFRTDAADLWDALTNPLRLPRWFLPISGDLHPGGTYQLEGNAGGAIEECDPPHRFRVTWLFGEGPATLVTVTLAPENAGTHLELEHVGQVPEQLWTQFGPAATGLGWDLTLHGLVLHVETGASMGPAEAAAWMASPEGVAVLRRSAQAWQEADVAAGTSPAEAAARIERTLAVYTGQAEPPYQC